MGEFDDLNLDNVPLMERLKHKIKLHDAMRKVWKTISAEKQTYPKSYARMIIRTLLKDAKKGIKVINKKNEVFIEMPKLESVGNGMIKKVYDGETVDTTESPIEVNSPDITYIEDKKSSGGV